MLDKVTNASVLKKLKGAVMFLLDPPWELEGPDTFTLAVPEAHSTFNRGSVGWANRPPALVRCPECHTEFDHTHASDIISCPFCSLERDPTEFDEVELIHMTCPNCDSVMDHGIRHPTTFDIPEYASCEQCQYHWEFRHDYGT